MKNRYEQVYAVRQLWSAFQFLSRLFVKKKKKKKKKTFFRDFDAHFKGGVYKTNI